MLMMLSVAVATNFALSVVFVSCCIRCLHSFLQFIYFNFPTILFPKVMHCFSCWYWCYRSFFRLFYLSFGEKRNDVLLCYSVYVREYILKYPHLSYIYTHTLMYLLLYRWCVFIATSIAFNTNFIEILRQRKK